MKTLTNIELTRVNNDLNGNPRYVVHFLDLLTKTEQTIIDKTSKSFESINNKYNKAIDKAKTIGGKKYRGKDFGGGIVFNCIYNTQNLIEKINNLL